MPVLTLTIKSPVGDFSGDLTLQAESEKDCIQGRDKLEASWVDLRYLVIYPERGNPKREILIPAKVLEQSVCYFSIENPPGFK